MQVDLTSFLYTFRERVSGILGSGVVLESGSVLESDSSPYFEDSDLDSNPLDSGLVSDVVLESGNVLESDSSPYFEDSESDSNQVDSHSDLSLIHI